MDLAEYKRLFGDQEDAAPGWDAINSRFDPQYEGQEPKHWGTVMKYMLGGPDPIDGISAYQSTEGGIDHLHFVTYGYTSLYYDPESVGEEHSNFGFEMTFRLAHAPNCEDDPIWVCSLMQNLARYVFDSGNYFAANHFIPTNGPICVDAETDLVGLVFLEDTTCEPVQSPHGRIEFVQGFGVTQSELDRLLDKSADVEQILQPHRADNPLLVTDLSRKNG